MKSIKRLYKSYIDIDGELSKLESHSSTTKKKTKWATKRAHNDHAFYVLFFAQFEDYIKSRSNKVVNKKINSAKWGNRKLWDTVVLNKLPFKIRVSLLTDKGKSDYAKIIDFYSIRNNIAHGSVLGNTSPILISSYVNDLLAICRNFKN